MGLSKKRQRFIQEYAVDLNITQAAIRAGYSAKTAGQIGSELLKIPEVQQAVQQLLENHGEKAKGSQQWILDRIIENIERAMQIRPVVDKEGNEIGEFTYQGNVANKALELLARHRGMLHDKLTLEDNRLPDLSKLSPDDIRKLREARDAIRPRPLPPFRGPRQT